MNIALKLDYVGTDFHGWQRQPDVPTVQAAVEDAFAALTGLHAPVTGCGRTDAGVHAKGYIANIRTDISVPMGKLPFALNAHMPRSICVYRVRTVPEDFHAVFSCTGKEYIYTIQNGPFRDPFTADRAMFVPFELNVDMMRLCAKEFLGSHDFAAMRSVGSNVKTTVRTVYSCDVESKDGFITVRIKANGFLYNMARTMTGTLMYAGLGKIGPGDITRIIASGDRGAAGPTLEAQGLCMTGVWYGDIEI